MQLTDKATVACTISHGFVRRLQQMARSLTCASTSCIVSFYATFFFFFPSLSQAAKFGHLNGPKNMEEATQARKSKLDSLPLTGTVYLKKTEYE